MGALTRNGQIARIERYGAMMDLWGQYKVLADESDIRTDQLAYAVMAEKYRTEAHILLTAIKADIGA